MGFMAVYSHVDHNNLITGQKICPNILCQIFIEKDTAKIEDFHANFSTDLSVFALKIGHQNLLFSTDLIRLCHNSPLICYSPKIISILEKIGPNILKRLLIFNLFIAH